MTFSIAAADPATGEVGVAVASKFLAVGSVVAWARAGAGAVATQALANARYGPDGLELLAQGMTADEVVRRLTEADDGRADRQLGVVTAAGNAASATGERCFSWAGGTTGAGYAIQGNILTGPGVVEAMATAWRRAEGPFVERLLVALRAGDDAGGDRRGRQSAAILVCQDGSGYGGGTDVKVDLRVDDHPNPVGELARLLRLYDLLFGQTPRSQWLTIDDALAADLRGRLALLGHDPGRGPGFDPALERALRAWTGAENLEERWAGGDRIDPVVVERLQEVTATATYPDRDDGPPPTP
jgi:uncharacterized Ntn-hydrolase superfamily protein